MKILIIYPDFPELNAGGCFYTGVASLSAVLKQAGHEVDFYHICFPVEKTELQDRLLAFEPDVIAFSSTSPMFQYVARWLPWVKEVSAAYVVCGGVHCRMAPERVLQIEGIDAVCHGEGELSFATLLERLSTGRNYYDIPNFAFKTSKGTIKNPLELIKDLDSLPDPERMVFNHAKLYDYTKEGRASYAAFMCSRGCPFECAYCSNKRLKQDYADKGKYVRFYSAKRLIQQIKDHYKLLPDTEYVRIDDSNINLNRAWFTEFISLYKKEVNKPIMVQTRPDLVNEKVIKSLKEAGCFILLMGLEHGNQNMRKDVLNRPLKDEAVLNAFQLCHKYGLPTRSFNMVGLPTETIDGVLETVKLNARVKPFDISTSIFYPFPYTALADYCEERKLRLKPTYMKAWPNTILEQDSIHHEDVLFFYKAFHILVFVYSVAPSSEHWKTYDNFLHDWLKDMRGKWHPGLFEEIGALDAQIHALYKNHHHPDLSNSSNLLFRI
ncbi:MAG: radical SAM protein [bacterium]